MKVPPTSTPSLYAIPLLLFLLAGDRRERAGAVDLTFELPPEHALEPLGDADQRVEVDARLDPLAVEQVDEVLGGDVARSRGARTGSRRSRRPTRRARSRRPRPRRSAFAKPGVARVVQVHADRACRA